MKSKNKDEVALPHANDRGILRSKDMPVGAPAGPTREEIQERAYEIHVEQGRIHGRDLEDWLQAEQELKEKYDGH